MKKLFIAASILLCSFSAQAAQDPEAVFTRSCGACHNGQLPMAPKKVMWQPGNRA